MAVKTLIVTVGESGFGTGVIKSTAKILSVGIMGNLDAESNCVHVDEAISNAEAYACYELVWEGDSRDSGSGSWQLDGVTFEAIEVDGTSYEINVVTNDLAGIANKIKQVVPSSVMKLGETANGKAYFYSDDNDKVRLNLCFLTLPSLATKIRARFRNSRLSEGGAPEPEYYTYARPLSDIDPELILGIPNWCTCEGAGGIET